MGGGLSIGPSAAKRSIGQEWPQIQNLFKSTFGQPGGTGGLLGSYSASQPWVAALDQFLPGLSAAWGPISSVLESGGNLPGSQQLAADRITNEQTAADQASRGMATTTSAPDIAFANREQAKQNRFQNYLGMAGNLITEMISPQIAKVQEYTGLTSPLLGYASNLFAGNQAAQQQQQQSNLNKGAGTISGVESIVGDVLGGVAMSDEKLKEKIKDTGGKGPEGIPIKTFAYKGDPSKQRFIGYVAQDVEKKSPGSVVRMPGGMKGVRSPFLPMPIKGFQRGGQVGGGDDTIIAAKRGEYVIPAEVVRRKGTDFFDKMIEPPDTDKKPGGKMTRSGLIGFAHGGGIEPDILPGNNPNDLRFIGFDAWGDFSPGMFKNLIYGGNPGMFSQMSNFLPGYSALGNLPGSWQGNTMIPTFFDAQGYPYAPPVSEPDYTGYGTGGLPPKKES
jgi:hypothetical protein